MGHYNHSSSGKDKGVAVQETFEVALSCTYTKYSNKIQTPVLHVEKDLFVKDTRDPILC